MSIFITDVESDGPIMGKHSMVCFGMVKLTPELDTTFYGQTRPISDEWIESSLAVSGFNRIEHMGFDDPVKVMKRNAEWLKDNSTGKPILLSDNNGYDASWINYYFHMFYGSNPFGWSSRRIGDLFCGAEHNLYYSWKKHRKTNHTHHPVDDAMGNAEAVLYLFNKFNIKLPK